MKLLMIILRTLCRIAGILVIIYVFKYAYDNPSNLIGKYIRLPLVFLAIKTLPNPKCGRKKRVKVFADNREVFEEYGQHLAVLSERDRFVAYHSRDKKASEEAPETAFACALICYVKEKDDLDGVPYIRIKKRKWRKGYAVHIRYNGHPMYLYYWIPDSEKFFFMNFRFDKAVELSDNWFLTG